MTPAVLRRVRAGVPSFGVLRRDAVAGLPGAIGSVPDGMAASVLAGVNPIYGLYASFAGPVAGGLTASTRLMVITTTSAAALAAGSAISDVPAAERPAALLLLTLLAGAAMIAAGLARLGRVTRFVAHSVMIGFLTGVAVNIVLSQVPVALGARADGEFALAKALDLLTHLGRVEVAAALTGTGAVGLLLVLTRTPLRSVAAVVALVIPTAALALLGVEGITRVSDVGAIPQGLPVPALPDLGAMRLSLVTGALSVAAIVLVQGAGVREVAPNPGGQPSRIDRDFVAQGIGNVAASLVKGQPVGGSVGQTALNVAAGARTRWAAIFSGLWMLLILVVLSGAVGTVAMPTLAAVLIVAAIGSIRIPEITTVGRASAQSAVAMITTFVATLLLPIAAAVAIGVALSLLLQLNREAIDLRVMQRVRLPDGRFQEQPARSRTSQPVTLLEIYGSLLFAGARTLEEQLPAPEDIDHPAVVLRLRGRVALGATFIVVVRAYAERVEAAGGRLFLSGVDPHVLTQLVRTGAVGDEGSQERVFLATSIVGESTGAAYAAAEAWRTHRLPNIG